MEQKENHFRVTLLEWKNRHYNQLIAREFETVEHARAYASGLIQGALCYDDYEIIDLFCIPELVVEVNFWYPMLDGTWRNIGLIEKTYLRHKKEEQSC